MKSQSANEQIKDFGEPCRIDGCPHNAPIDKIYCSYHLHGSAFPNPYEVTNYKDTEAKIINLINNEKS